MPAGHGILCSLLSCAIFRARKDTPLFRFLQSKSQITGQILPVFLVYRYEIIDNPFIKTADQNVSTFSVHADGAAYSYMKLRLSSGMHPDKSSVRIEEYINYFPFDYANPTGDHAHAINPDLLNP